MDWWELFWQRLVQTGWDDDFVVVGVFIVGTLWALIQKRWLTALITAALLPGLVVFGTIVRAADSIAMVHRLGLLHVTCCAASIYVVFQAIRRKKTVGLIAYWLTVGNSVPITIFALLNGWSHVPWTFADTLQLFGITLFCGLVWAIHCAGYPKEFSEVRVLQTSEERWTGVTYVLALSAIAVFLPVWFPWGKECTTAKCLGARYWIGPVGSVSNLYLSQWFSATTSVVIGSAIVRVWRRESN